MLKTEKAELKRHRKALADAQAFFLALETKYEGEDGEPVDGAPVGPYGEAAEAISHILMDV